MKKFLLIAIILFSCKRETETTPPPSTSDPDKIAVHLTLSGDISTSWSDLRTIYDSTIYAVNIRTNAGALFAQGLFDNPDSIKIEIFKDSSYLVNVAVIRRGSSLGLWWELSSDGYRQYPVPLHRKLRNRMAYAVDEPLEPGFIDSLSAMKVLTDTVTRTYSTFPYPELDSYYGTTNYTARNPADPNISIELRRLVFAIRYDVHNLTTGFLQASYEGKMTPDTIRTNDTLPSRIYTVDAYRAINNTPAASVQLTLTWIKGNGTSEVLGTKPITSKRNSITYVSVYLNTPPVQTQPVITLKDTVWSGTDDFDF